MLFLEMLPYVACLPPPIGGWCMLWAHSGGQMTQLNQFYCRLMKFIFVPVCLSDELCSELYNLGLPAEGKNEQTP